MYEDRTPETITKDILDGMGDGINTVEGSFAADAAARQALEMSKIYGHLDEIRRKVLLLELAGEELREKAREYDIEPKQGTFAKFEIVVQTMGVCTIPKGAVIVTDDGQRFLTADVLEAMADGEHSLLIVANTVGKIGHSYTPDEIRFLRVYHNLNKIIDAHMVSDGTNEESDAELLARVHQRLRTPPGSGNKTDYKRWAMEVEGVGEARVIPKKYGPGTVAVLVIGQDDEEASTEALIACYDHIMQECPLVAELSVEPIERVQIDVQATIVADSGIIDQIKDKFMDTMAAYLKKIAASDKAEFVSCNKVRGLLCAIEGVDDYTALTVNNGTVNIAIPADKVPILGDVVIENA